MFKLHCKNPFRKISQAIKDFFNEIQFEESHCYICKRELTEEEIDTAKRWIIGGDNYSVLVCDACVKEMREAWNKRQNEFLQTICNQRECAWKQD